MTEANIFTSEDFLARVGKTVFSNSTKLTLNLLKILLFLF